jgi:hypothetical protein
VAAFFFLAASLIYVKGRDCYMFYSVYEMYDEGMQIMIPSHLKQTKSLLASQYTWSSDDKKTLINVTRGHTDLEEDNLESRLDEYCRRFSKSVKGFDCKCVKKRSIQLRPYMELRYRSKMARYEFFNIFLLGIYEGRELIVTIQYLEDDSDYDVYVFENIEDSIRVNKKHIDKPEEKLNENQALLKLIYVSENKDIIIDKNKDELIIGRDANNTDFVIPEEVSCAVSRRHCIINRINNKYFVQDLKSSNHTLINGIMIPPYELMELFNNDILTLADLEFRAKIRRRNEV